MWYKCCEKKVGMRCKRKILSMPIQTQIFPLTPYFLHLPPLLCRVSLKCAYIYFIHIHKTTCIFIMCCFLSYNECEKYTFFYFYSLHYDIFPPGCSYFFYVPPTYNDKVEKYFLKKFFFYMSNK